MREDRNCQNECNAPLSSVNKTMGICCLLVPDSVFACQVCCLWPLQLGVVCFFFLFFFLSVLLEVMVDFHNQIKLKYSLVLWNLK